MSSLLHLLDTLRGYTDVDWTVNKKQYIIQRTSQLMWLINTVKRTKDTGIMACMLPQLASLKVELVDQLREQLVLWKNNQTSGRDMLDSLKNYIVDRSVQGGYSSSEYEAHLQLVMATESAYDKINKMKPIYSVVDTLIDKLQSVNDDEEDDE